MTRRTTITKKSDEEEANEKEVETGKEGMTMKKKQLNKWDRRIEREESFLTRPSPKKMEQESPR